MNQALMMLMRARGAAPSSVQPSDFAGLSAWWKADNDTFVTGTTQATDGETITDWADSSGNGYFLNVASSGFRPTFRANAVNGLPALDFDGDDRMSSSAPTGGNEQTLFAVVNADVLQYAQLRSPAGGGAVLGMWLDASGHLVLGTPGTAVVTSSGTISAGTWHILSGSASAAGDFMRARIDGTQTQATWTGTLTGTRGTRVSYDSSGVNGFFDGKLAELISYQELLSDADIAAVEGYLATKYGL